jgi:hypothetical protein
MMDLTALAQDIHDLAKSKGWWDKPRSELELDALIHSEIAEATEAVRDANIPPPIHQGRMSCGRWIMPGMGKWNPSVKPEGEAIELADAAIRALDAMLFLAPGIPLDVIPPVVIRPTRPIEVHADLHEILVLGKGHPDYLQVTRLMNLVAAIVAYFDRQGWKFEMIVRIKHDYNKTRPYRHGKTL